MGSLFSFLRRFFADRFCGAGRSRTRLSAGRVLHVGVEALRSRVCENLPTGSVDAAQEG